MRATASDWGEYGEYRAYLSRFAGDNSESRGRLLTNLKTAICEELTDRQREVLKLYYINGLTMTETARELNVCVSTVSRTLERARKRLRRALRYGAKNLLTDDI